MLIYKGQLLVRDKVLLNVLMKDEDYVLMAPTEIKTDKNSGEKYKLSSGLDLQLYDSSDDFEELGFKEYKEK